MSWTEEKVEKLKELWGKGSTASQIAEIIGGISRNAVIGKAHRLNLSSKITKTRSSSICLQKLRQETPQIIKIFKNQNLKKTIFKNVVEEANLNLY